MPKKIIKLTEMSASPSREWYNNWLEENASGSILDVGKSIHWDYSGLSYAYKTIDTNQELNPDFLQDICSSSIFDKSFDLVLCNGMYEFVSDPQKMVDEVIRILKPKGKAIFGFVGKNYPPYKKDWNYYDNNINFNGFDIIHTENMDNYHFIYGQKTPNRKQN